MINTVLRDAHAPEDARVWLVTVKDRTFYLATAPDAICLPVDELTVERSGTQMNVIKMRNAVIWTRGD
jgi:hypothetical protein